MIIEPKRNKVLFSKKADETREMASLTKIMTMMVTLKLSKELKIDMKNTWFRVSALAASTIGTSADLTENQRVTVHDLLYGLMLPSGNDAAMTLAEGFSDLIIKARQRPSQTPMQHFVQQQKQSQITTISAFVKEMNLMA